MIAAPPVLLDPFELEATLAVEARVLSYHPRVFELSVDELVRLLSFDIVGDQPLGTTYEHVGENGAGFLYSASYYQVGPQVLALATEIDEGTTRHRVLELLGVSGDVRVRLNAAVLRSTEGRDLSKSARAAVDAGRAIGQVRLWTSRRGRTTCARRSRASSRQRGSMCRSSGATRRSRSTRRRARSGSRSRRCPPPT